MKNRGSSGLGSELEFRGHISPPSAWAPRAGRPQGRGNLRPRF